MEYLIDIRIASSTDEVTQERIKQNLNQGTLRLSIFPKVGMPIGLLNGAKIVVEDILPLQKKEQLNPDAVAWVRHSN